MKVLLVTETIHPGGAETFVLRLAKKLNQSGIQAGILSLNPDLENRDLIKQFPELTIHHTALPLLKWIKRADRLLKKIKLDFSLQDYLLCRHLTDNYIGRYDVFHTHLIPVDYMFAKIKSRHPYIRIVSTLHGDYNEFEYLWQANHTRKKLNWPTKVDLVKKKINAWVYISEDQKDLFHNVFHVSPGKLHKIYNGFEPVGAVPVADKTQRTTDGLHFIMVARGIQPKGWDYLIRAFLQLEGNNHLTLVGKGDYLDALQKEYGKHPQITFAGFHPAPVVLINEADVFVFPSVYKTESLPTVLIEALYCGVPVISTDIGEVKEMLKAPGTNELAGFVVDKEKEENIVPLLVKAMNTYLGDRSLLAHHATLARSAFVKFDMSACCNQYIKLYKQVCEAV